MDKKQFDGKVIGTLPNSLIHIRAQDGHELTVPSENALKILLKYAEEQYPGQFDSAALEW